jgi:hypothetical protein
MWYFLQFYYNKPNTYIEINGSFDRINPMFTIGYNIDKLKYFKITANAQKGLTDKLLNEADYLEDIRMGNIPVFSEKFVEKMGNHLSGFIEYYPCNVNLKENNYLFYIAKINNLYSVVNYNKSGKRKLTDGSDIISAPYVIKHEIDEKLLIIRDTEYKTKVIVSELFKKIVEENKLKIKFTDMKRKVEEKQLEKIKENGGIINNEKSIWLLDFWGKKNVLGLIMMPITRHQTVHLNDCFNIKEKYNG